MKKILAVSLALFLFYMSYVLAGGFIQKQLKENDSNSASSTVTAPISPTANTDTFTIDQIAIHSSASDCWLVINNNVYSVAKFLGDHPGGASTIIPYCGKEATNAFDTQDKGSRGGHSSQAVSLLANYMVGSLSRN